MMRYFLAGFLGFLLSGIWFGIQLWLKQFFAKKRCGRLVYFSPLFAACIPIGMLFWMGGLCAPRLSNLADGKMWALSAATLLVTCLIKRISGRKCRSTERRELAWMCMEAAFVEIAQRLMMQSFLMNLLDAWGCGTIWCVLLNALVWCAGILIQASLSHQKMGKELALDLIASFVFSIGCGYVFYRSGCIVFSVAAHMAERLIVTMLER